MTEVLAQRLGPTLLLFGLGEIIAIVLGLVLGAYSGWKRGGVVDYVGNGLADPVLDAVLPASAWACSSSSRPASAGSRRTGCHAGGPSTTPDRPARSTSGATSSCRSRRSSLGLVGQYAILMRSSVIETLREDYITTARAKGLADGRVLRQHALPNALLPTVTLVAINLGYVVAGAITVEVVFNWPGLGTLTVEALAARDYPVLQGVFLLLSVAVVLANLVADLVYGILDPRVRT